MKEREPNLVTSGLSRRVTRDGITVELCIYRLEAETEWALEVINSARTSIVWDGSFPSYEARRDTFMMPYYDFTARLAEFNAPTETQVRLNRAFAASPTETARLFGAVALTFNPDELFAPQNVSRLISAIAD